MNTNIIQLDTNATCLGKNAHFTLSLRPLIAYLQKRLASEKSLKVEFYRFLLEKIEREPALQMPIRAEELVKYKDTLELIFTILTPLMENEKELLWGMGTPLPHQIFFSTQAFYKFMGRIKEQKNDGEPELTHEHKLLRYIYRMVLQRFYGYMPLSADDIIYSYTNPDTNLTKFYKINADSRFIDISYEGELPELNYEIIAEHLKDGSEVAVLSKALPLTGFKFDGFSVITVTDVTLQHAIDGIRNALVKHTYEKEAYEHVIQALKTLAGDGSVEFGLLPFLKVNGKFVFDNEENSQSILLDVAKKMGKLEESFFALVDEYQEHPRPVLFNNLDEQKIETFPFLKVLYDNGIKSYSFLPVFYNNELAGVLEIYAYQELTVNEQLLSKLHAAMPLLGQLLRYRIEDFHNNMDEVLKDKFTALQPSVQWKFNEAVWKYVKGNRNKRKNSEIDTVTFKSLYPLFGAIDIKNSTIERNHALKLDLKVLLEKLIACLLKIKATLPLDLLDKLIFDCREWKRKISDKLSSSEESQLNEFLDEDLYPLLKHLGTSQEAIKPLIDGFFQVINPVDGEAFENRRSLETSMRFINTAVSDYLEDAQDSLQKSYPCYFAKFRTDGVEYDIYIGQELAPERPFDLLYLKNIRLWQLTAMVDVARLTNGLVTQMPRPLLTTQLVFIHSNPIDISFRNDERRFDVEGAYNIRYEVVKKRIDKVLIKGTTERLTQPGKIALVYFNGYEANEYKEYITYLQEQGYLNNDLEFLELEELQGVSGLKALRVGVNYLSCDFYDEKCEQLKRKVAKPIKKVAKAGK